MVGNGRRVDVQLRGDLGVRGTLAGQAGDLRFAGGQGISRLRGASGRALARRTQFYPCPSGKRPCTGRGDNLLSGAKLIAGFTAAALAAQPLAAEQAGAAQVNTQASAAEAARRLTVKILRGLIHAPQRARARLDSQRPVGAAGAGGLREPVEGLGRLGPQDVAPESSGGSATRTRPSACTLRVRL